MEVLDPGGFGTNEAAAAALLALAEARDPLLVDQDPLFQQLLGAWAGGPPLNPVQGGAPPAPLAPADGQEAKASSRILLFLLLPLTFVVLGSVGALALYRKVRGHWPGAAARGAPCGESTAAADDEEGPGSPRRAWLDLDAEDAEERDTVSPISGTGSVPLPAEVPPSLTAKAARPWSCPPLSNNFVVPSEPLEKAAFTSRSSGEAEAPRRWRGPFVRLVPQEASDAKDTDTNSFTSEGSRGELSWVLPPLMRQLSTRLWVLAPQPSPPPERPNSAPAASHGQMEVAMSMRGSATERSLSKVRWLEAPAAPAPEGAPPTPPGEGKMRRGLSATEALAKSMAMWVPPPPVEPAPVKQGSQRRFSAVLPFAST